MGINTIMKNALRANWTKTDDFQFIFTNKSKPLTVSGGGMSVQDVLDISVINIDLPQLGSAVESVMQAGEWRIYNAKFEPFSFSITFRDFGSLDLRNYFSSIWMDAQRGYYENVKSFIKISIGEKVVFESEDCLITAVSQVQLDNSNSQIAEFTVEFSTPYYSNDEISKFGSDGYFKAEATAIGSSSSIFSSTINGEKSILTSLQSIASTIGNLK